MLIYNYDSILNGWPEITIVPIKWLFLTQLTFPFTATFKILFTT